MKKSLLAVAAISAFASAAQAQSSVTVYGILDVGYVGSNEKNTGTTVNKQSTNQLGASAQQSSRLGFKGTEDLGGGKSAFFTLETGLTPNDSTLSTFNNRQAFVGLSQKGIGAASIGRQYGPIHNSLGKTDPGQLNNVVGSVIYPSSSGITQQQENANSASSAYTTSFSNAIVAKSDTFAGFTGTALYSIKNQNQDQVTAAAATTGGTTNLSGYGLGVDYAWKKLLVSANMQSFKSETSAAATTSLAVNSTTGAITVTNGTDNQQYVAATYDFGILKGYVNYVNRKVTSALNSNEYLSRSGQQIGVRSFITPTVEAWASGGNGRYRASGVASPTANFTAWQLGSNYWLSKRTNLYAIYGQNQTSQVTAAAGSYNVNNYAVGVRHTF